MAARAIASINISFGLVTIPVKSYLVAKSDDISLKLINPETGNPLTQKMVDKVTDEEVDRQKCSRGFEVAKNQYIIFSKDELESLRPEKSENVDISEFVPVSELNPLIIEKSYSLSPNKFADKAYRLLLKALEQNKVCAIGRNRRSGKDHLVAIRSMGDDLIMHQIFYATEIREFENSCAPVPVGNKELELARTLISQMTNKKFNHAKYYDQYIHELRIAAEKKQEGKGLSKVGSVANARSIDLMEALVGSLEGKDVSSKKHAKKPKPKKAVQRKKTG